MRTVMRAHARELERLNNRINSVEGQMWGLWNAAANWVRHSPVGDLVKKVENNDVVKQIANNPEVKKIQAQAEQAVDDAGRKVGA